MQSLKYFYSGLLTIGLLFWTSCNKEELESYLVSIDIDAPAAVKVGEPFDVTINYERDNDIIHNVLIEIVNEQGHQTMKLEERHVHEANSYSFSQANIVLDNAGTYTLRANTTDLHDGESHEEEDAGAHSHSEDMAGHDADASSEKSHNTLEHTIVVQ